MGLGEALQAGKANIHLEWVFLPSRMNFWPFQGRRGSMKSTCHQVVRGFPWGLVPYWVLGVGLCSWPLDSQRKQGTVIVTMCPGQCFLFGAWGLGLITQAYPC